jgi:cytoskeletal protein CcmA (bactofilin family)
MRLPHDFSSSHRHVASPRPLDQTPTPAKLAGVQTRSVIDQRLLITGDLEGDCELLVEGRVKGNIRCTHVLVGKDGRIIGNVTANEVVVRGEVNGTIHADSVILQHNARVDGEVSHKMLTIEAGAYFEGRAHRSNNPMNAEALNPLVSELLAETKDTPIAVEEWTSAERSHTSLNTSAGDLLAGP